MRHTRIQITLDNKIICDRLWQKQTFGKEIGFVDFSLELINNNF